MSKTKKYELKKWLTEITFEKMSICDFKPNLLLMVGRKYPCDISFSTPKKVSRRLRERIGR